MKEVATTVCNIHHVVIKDLKVDGLYAVPVGELPTLDNIFSLHSTDILKFKKLDSTEEYKCLLFSYPAPETFSKAGYVYPSHISPHVKRKKSTGTKSSVSS